MIRKIQLPNNVRNFKIEDNIPNSSQVVLLDFKTGFYYDKPKNLASKKTERLMCDLFLNLQGGSDNIIILEGCSCAIGRNINDNPSPTNLNILGYYFMWSFNTEYPTYQNMGVIDINNPIDIYTQEDIERNVTLYWTDVDIWNPFDDVSIYNRDLFFNAIGFDPDPITFKYKDKEKHV